MPSTQPYDTAVRLLNTHGGSVGDVAEALLVSGEQPLE